MTPKIPTEGVTRFLNVDLELVSTGDIDPLLAHWSDEMVTLRDSTADGRRVVWIELGRDPQDADIGIREFARLVEALPVSLRERWDACADRCFNVGVQGGGDSGATAFRISENTIRALATMSARLELTVYGSGIQREGRRG